MKAFVIYLPSIKYSIEVSDRCVKSAANHGITLEKIEGVSKEIAESVMNAHKLTWTWADNNTKELICSKTNLKHFPYRTTDFRSKIGCSMSHFLLWKKCVELNETILILEHDAVFLRPLPNIEFKGICQINDPNGATRKGNWWSKHMVTRNKCGVFEKTWVTTEPERHIPDGLAGNSAYLIKPWAAQALINKCYEVGLWLQFRRAYEISKLF
jgi:GR25 family glycosyltransferase involved in LPS biosynthesis